MNQSPSPTGQPHLVSLVLQSKKALQHGEQLCSRANALSNASAQVAVDVLALDAKVRWIGETMLEQLKSATGVAKSLEVKRAALDAKVREWDKERTQRTEDLDAVLDSLGKQLVPPSFHEGSASSSLFGSQHSDSGTKPSIHDPRHSPTATLRNEPLRAASSSKRADRSKWKTLRDFVDERAIEDCIEVMDNDRATLDEILSTSHSYPSTLTASIGTIRSGLTTRGPVPSIEQLLITQEDASTRMAGHLESLAAHFDQMAGALRDGGAEAFGEEDLQDMNRDTEELPAIMTELEDGFSSIEAAHEQLNTAKILAQEQLDSQSASLDDLDELGEIMSDMLRRQQSVQADAEQHLEDIHHHLGTLEDLHARYVFYQASFNKLLLEIDRRRAYRDAAAHIVQGMTTQLDAMAEEERRTRDDFRAEHGAHLPEDICLSIENVPTRWEVRSWNGELLEEIPEIDADLLKDAQERVARAEAEATGTESL